MTDGERQHRSRQRRRQHHRGDTRAGHDGGGVTGEDIGVATGVVAHHNRRAAVRHEIRRQPGRRARHHDPIHPVAAWAESATKSRRAELKRAVERVGKFINGRGVPRFGAIDQCRQFRGRHRIRILGQPGARGVEQCHGSVPAGGGIATADDRD